MNVDELKKNLHDVIERYRNKAEFTGEVCRVVMARDCLQVVEELEAENERLKEKIERLECFCNELIKDCKWLPITRTPSIYGFETMVQCTNGKKRVASFRMFDSHWYDVNNGNKLNVVKWLWQPSIPQGEG